MAENNYKRLLEGYIIDLKKESKVIFDEEGRGMISASLYEDSGECLFSHLYVLPEWRSKGIAQALTTKMEAWAAENKAQFLTCMIHHADPNQASYNFKGFLQYGFYPYMVSHGFLIMRKDI